MKVKVKVAIKQDMKTQTGSSIVLISSFNLVAKWQVVIIIIIIIIIIIFITCNWVVTRWQWLFYMYTKHEIGY